jgi:hypothetical protein
MNLTDKHISEDELNKLIEEVDGHCLSRLLAALLELKQRRAKERTKSK